MEDLGNIFRNHGIDYDNAVEYFNRCNKTGCPEDVQIDAYEALLSFIKRHPNWNYDVDETPITLNRKSKILSDFIWE